MPLEHGRTLAGRCGDPLHIADAPAAGQHEQVGERRLDDRLVERRVGDERVDGGGRHPEPGGRVALGVEIDQQRPQARMGQAGGDVRGGGRLADATLLVGHAENPSHAQNPSRRSRTHNWCFPCIGHVGQDRHIATAAAA
jgi:hypothetical protein